MAIESVEAAGKAKLRAEKGRVLQRPPGCLEPPAEWGRKEALRSFPAVPYSMDFNVGPEAYTQFS